MAYETLKDPVALQAEQAALQSSFFNRVFGWMFAGLGLSGAVAWTLAKYYPKFICDPRVVLISCILTLVVVLGLSFGIKKMSAGAATVAFIVYAGLDGVMLSSIFLAYELGSVVQVFCITAAMFGAMGLWGYITKSDLSGLGSICFMGLIGIIIASLINLFLGSNGLDFVISIFGVLIFTGLTAYDVQKIKRLAEAAGEGLLTDEIVKKCAILGALTLYLDFVNLFLYLLRLFGRRK